MTALLASHGRHVVLAALCAGLAAANAVRVSDSALAGGVVLFVVAVVYPRARLPCLCAGLLVAGCVLGSWRLDAIDRQPLAGDMGRVARARVVVTGPTRRTPFALRVPARIERFGARRARDEVLLELPLGRAPPQGAVLELTGKLSEPRGPDSGWDERTWLRRHGVHAVLDGRDWRVVGRRGGLLGYVDRLRASMVATLSSGVSGERRAVLLGVVLGEDEGLDRDLRDAFRASGLYHLLAVSGSNVALVAGGVLLVAWLIGIPRLAAECGALAAIGAYVLAVGTQPSVVRAGVAGALASLAWITARAPDRWWFLLLGALVSLAWSPYSLLDPGFQLSFAAVAAIFLAVQPLMRRLEGYPVPRPLAAVVAVSTACGVVTAPIVLLQFGSVPAYSVVANAIAAPVVAPLLGLGLMATALRPLDADAASLLVWLDGWLAGYLTACARFVAHLPHAQLAPAPVIVIGVGVLALVVSRRWGLVSGRIALYAVLALAIAVGWRATGTPAHRPQPAGLRITFLDVGQGDGALVETRDATILVDQGPPEADVSAQLRRLGVGRLSLVVLTHPQRDHIGGAADVLNDVGVDRVLDPRLAISGPEEREALAVARARHIPVDTARPGVAYGIGRLRVRVLWPDGPGLPSDDPNLNATVLLVSYGQTDALFTADAESGVLLQLHLPPVEVLKVAHHGSADPLLPELLDLTRPRVAVVSVGEGNTYGHPRPETLAALAARRELAVYRTDEDGAVTVESDGREITVATEH